jgi:iron(II)-dependent oxidoreductase
VLVSPSVSTLDRTALQRRYRENRARTAELFALVDPAAYYERPISLRHPFVFYEGHIPAFSLNKLVREALDKPAVDAGFERLFERGIDPSDTREAARHARDAWPERGRVRAFGDACDVAVLDAYANADLTDGAASPLLVRGEAAFNILEHEEMHHETLLYIIHRLPRERKRSAGRTSAFLEAEPVARGRVVVAAGSATLGARRDELTFGWDNEFERTTVGVPAFEIDVNDVTNGDWLAFVRAGVLARTRWRVSSERHVRGDAVAALVARLRHTGTGERVCSMARRAPADGGRVSPRRLRNAEG